MKLTKKIISVFLSILTLFSICSVSTTVFAAEYAEQKARTEYFDSALSDYLKNIVDTENAVSISEIEQVEEAVEEANKTVTETASTFSLRTASAQSAEKTVTDKNVAEDLDIDHTRLTLKLENGENVAYLFSEPISFIDDDGNLVYKDTGIETVTDNAFLNRGYSFENCNNDYKTYFSADSQKGVLIVLNDGNEISLVPNGERAIGESIKLNNDGETLDAFSYQNVYGTGTLLRFLPQLNGIKDEIVLENYNGKSDFGFTLHTGDNTAAINSKGEIEIINNIKEVVHTFAVPFAYDAQGTEGDTSEHYTDCSYSLEKISNGIYNLNVCVPEQFLTSEETVYPVTVDPTTGNVMVTNDSAVYSARADEGHGANPTACFGKTGSSQYGKGRALFFFRVPSDIESYAKITEAKLWLRETTGRTETMYVRPYLNKEAWASTVTWNTQPAHYSTFTYPGKTDLTLGRRNINSNSTDKASSPYWYAFNITNAVRAWTTGTNNKGLKFIAECEAADGDYLWRAFATKEHSTSSYHPYAVITYTNDTTAPTFSVSGNPTEWTKSNVTLTVSATDEVYGAAGVAHYSFDNGSTWQTSSKKTFDKNQTVYIKVKDKAGNISAAKTVKITKIDKTKPTATITFSPTSWTNGSVTATIKMTDNAAIAKYTINGTATTLDADGSDSIKSKTVTKTYSSDKTVSVTVTDAAGNAVTVSNSFDNIDKVSPQITGVTGNPTAWTNKDVTLKVAATDEESGVASYSFTNKENTYSWQTGNSKSFTENQTVYIYVKDKAGNISKGTTVTISKIDKKAPTAEMTFSPTTPTNGTVTATIKLADDVALKSYKIDSDAVVNVSGTSKTVTKNYDTDSDVTVIVTDAAGNSTTITKSFNNIDTVKPVIQSVSGNPSQWTNSDVTLTVSASDDESGIESYSFDNGATWSDQNNNSFETNRTVYIKVKDKAGNISDTTVVYITKIDKEKPVIADIALDNVSWTNGNVKVIVTANDADCGLNETAYSFDNGTTWQKENYKLFSDNKADINIKVRDALGNIAEYISNPVQINNIDKVKPVIQSVSGNPTQWTDKAVTLTVNATDENSQIEKYSFDNGKTWQTDKSKTFESNQDVYIYAKDKADNISEVYVVKIEKIDSDIPVITSVDAPDEWTNQTSTVKINATDNGSGIAYYSFDGGKSWQRNNSSNYSAHTTVQIKVKDSVGHESEVWSQEVKVDQIPPDISVFCSTSDWTNQNVFVSIGGDDEGGSHIWGYSYDGGDTWISGEASLYTKTMNETLQIWVKDFAGNITKKTATVKIDKETPIINNVTVSQNDEWKNNQAIVTVDATDKYEGIDVCSGVSAYSFDGGETWQEDNYFTYTENENNIILAVKDKAGNVSYYKENEDGVLYTTDIEEATPVSISGFDYESPQAPVVYAEGDSVYLVDQHFDFDRETESPEHLEYKIGDDGEWTTYEEELTLVNTVHEKKAIVYARSCDKAGNISQETSVEIKSTLGEYTASYTDIALGEGLFPVGFDRAYTSTNGWFFAFDANIKSFANGYVFTDFYGEKHYFIKNSEKKFISAYGEELTVNADSYVLIYGDMTCTFGLDGKLNRIATDYLDTAYTWNDDNSTLIITGGATVTFTDKKPTKINITREGQVKEVEYIWTGGNLTKFIDAEDVEHNYAYTNGLLTTNENETITYSDKNRVKLISQPDGAFVKYTYNDTAENTEIPNNIGAVTISDSKGITDICYYADGVYISNSIDSYSENATYDPETISDELIGDNVLEGVYVVVEEETDETQGSTSEGDTQKTEAEEPGTTAGNTEKNVSELPLYEETDENAYVFYTYDEQGRVTAEVKILKADISDITAATFEDALAVAENKVTYDYVSETDNNVAEKILYEKSGDSFVIKTIECYDYLDGAVQTYSKYEYENGDVKSHSKYKYVDGVKTIIYSENYEYNVYGNVSTHTEIQYATSADAYDMTYTTNYTYDVWGMCTGTTVSCENDVDTTTTEYDLNGATLSVTYNDEKVIYTYTDFGAVDKETVVKIDGDTETVRQETDYTYDAVGNLMTCLNPEGDTSYYYYDAYGNLTNHTFNGYAFTYNTLGSILTASVNDDVLVAYAYNGVEQELSSARYANGQTLKYAHVDGELTEVSQNGEIKFSYSYSDDGETTTVTDKINNIIKDIENDKVTVSVEDTPKTFIYSVENLYEDEETEGSFNGKKITVGTDVYTIKSEENKDTFLADETEDFVKTYEDDYAGNLWKVNTANAVSTEYGYNEYKNISTLKNSLNGFIQTFGYAYDDQGNITTETLTTTSSDEVGATVETNESIHYTYDDKEQLVSAETSSIRYEYTYDDRGNILTKKEYSISLDENGEKVYNLIEENTDTYVYDETWADKLISYNGQSITYDAVGNPTNYMGNTLTWSMGRQLASFGNIGYTYNENGIRTSKTSNGVTTKFYLDGTNIIEQTDATTTLHFYYDSNDEVIGFNYNNADYFYVKNATSDIIGIADVSGNLIASYTYDAWGKVTSVTGSNTAIGEINPFRYRSYYYDSDIEMYYLQSRYYDPETGRFINSDDVNFIGFDGTDIGYNAFAYCGNEPINNADPCGLCYLNSSGNICHDNWEYGTKYSANKAIEYAKNWWNKRNKSYFRYRDTGNGDCANFVSQCLYAGGLMMNNSWHSFCSSKKPSKNRYDYSKWDCDYKKLPFRYYRVSNAWSTAKGLHKYLKSKYKYKTYSNVNSFKDAINKNKIKIGDVVFFKNKDHGVHHATIIGRIVKTRGNEDCYYYAHTKDRNANDSNSSICKVIRSEDIVVINIK